MRRSILLAGLLAASVTVFANDASIGSDEPDELAPAVSFDPATGIAGSGEIGSDERGSGDDAGLESVAASPTDAPRRVARNGAAMDRLDLDSTVITGNQELPKVLYIVPWKKAELGELPGRPVNSLVNEILEPVDRDEFRRRIGYYDTLFGNQVTDAPEPGE